MNRNPTPVDANAPHHSSPARRLASHDAPHDAPHYAAQARFDTPLGPLTAVATARGLAGLWFDGQRHHPGAIDAPDDPTHPHLATAARELTRYWQDGHHRFTVPLDPQGTPFQRTVWQALRAIAPGETDRYGALAERLGRPGAARAVGAAVGRNPISIVVPCHRVLGQDGALTGYAGGLDRKQALLRHERSPQAPEAGAAERSPALPAPRAHATTKAAPASKAVKAVKAVKAAQVARSATTEKAAA